MKIKFIMNLLLVLMLAFGTSLADNKDGKKLSKPTDKEGDSYIMAINNVYLPLNNTGVIAAVSDIGGRYGNADGDVFLFSSGFFLSGITNGTLWGNAVASASRVEDYVAGMSDGPKGDARAQMYVVSVGDGDFSQSWKDWIDAVALGAEFYDGNLDGVYNPVDLNSNGKWDATEDRPDIIGDQTIWCVFNDGKNPALRTWNTNEPQGIDVRQTVFGFQSKGVAGNLVFIRYSLVYKGNANFDAPYVDSVYFGVWADPDLGDPNDDLVGCDTALNAGFVYQTTPDNVFGVDPPCFLIDFFQGPPAYIPGETFTDNNANGIFDDGDVALDSAFNVRGKVRGIEAIPGAKNLGLSSFVHYQQSDPTLGDPDNTREMRNYMEGTSQFGAIPNPCTWTLGTVTPAGICSELNPLFWYSGDPVTKTGWLNSNPTDQRQMSNTGPFRLYKNVPVNIIVAYVVGRGADGAQSVTAAKFNDQTAQLIFDANFPSPPPPPAVRPVATTAENFIDIDWQTAPQISYSAQDTVLDINKRVQGFYVTQYRTRSTSAVVAGVENSKIIQTYDLADSIKSVYGFASNGGTDLRIQSGIQLDSNIYADTASGRIKIRLTQDAFTGAPFVKGQEYYFTVTQYTLNHNNVVVRETYLSNGTSVYGRLGDYLDLGGSLEEYESQLAQVTFGQNMYQPAIETGEIVKSGAASGNVSYVVVKPSDLTGDKYKVVFHPDTIQTTSYTPSWSLLNETKGTTLIERSKVYDFDTTKYAGVPTEGFIVKVQQAVPVIGDPVYKGTPWFDKVTSNNGVGPHYVGIDIPQAKPHPFRPAAKSSIITADKLKKVEIRFAPGKAYRYLNGFVGSGPTLAAGFIYGSGVAAKDTGGVKGPVGKLGEGFVDVPFQAWAVDEKLNIEQQLAVAFIERNRNLGGVADGIWDPKDSVNRTGEVIVVFDAPYDPTGSQVEYTGATSGTTTVWADVIRGWTPPAGNTMTAEQIRIAKSPWFNALYVVGLQKENPASTWVEGDVYTIPITKYPYTNNDSFEFTTSAGGTLSAEAQKKIFEKVNVFPNPLFAYNPATSYGGGNPDEPFVTFSNLPTDVKVQIFTLSGTLVRTLTTADKSSPSAPFLRWNLQNEEGLRVASGMYLAIVDAPGFGEKVLKFAVIMPQKQIQQF